MSELYLILTLFFCWLSLTSEAIRQTYRRRSSRTECHIADAIWQASSDKYLLWRDERPNPTFGFPFAGYNKSWMIFTTPHGRTTMLQFAHATNDGKCRFLKKRRYSNRLALSEAMECSSANIDGNTLFSTSLDPTMRRGISFTPRRLSHKLYIGHRQKS